MASQQPQKPQGNQASQNPQGGQDESSQASMPDPEAANTDETVQAEDRARSAVSGSGNTLGDGMTAGGGDRVEERKVFQEAGGDFEPKEQGGDPSRRYGGEDGKTANEEKGGEGDEDSASG